MMINRNLTSQIPFGYISASVLDDDIVNELQQRGTDPHYADALKEYLHSLEHDEPLTDEDRETHTQEFNDAYQPDEPIHEGEYEGVKYRTSWLGGALNVWVFESPHITQLARQASPCVPGAAILDTLDGNVTGYDVPPSWRRDVP